MRRLGWPVRLGLAAAVLAAAVWLVHSPALNRVFAVDQLWYFAELDGGTTMADGLRHVDYAATRRYWKDSDALYRPLLFVWLAVGNNWFGRDHVAWNAATLVLHTLAALAVYLLLWTIRPSAFALPTAVLFAVLAPPVELVLWHHLGGYLLAAACLALGLLAFGRLTREDVTGADDRTTLALFAASFGAAVFLHEVMVPIAALAAAVAWLTIGRRRAWPIWKTLVVWSPVLLFAAAYMLHMQRVTRLTYVDRPDVTSLLDAGNLLGLLPRTLETIVRWTREEALPASLSFTTAPYARLDKHLAFVWTSPVHLLNVALMAIVAAAAVWPGRTKWRRDGPILALLACAIVAYAAVTCLARPAHEALGIGYYLYTFGLLITAGVYILIDPVRLPRWLTAAAAVALAGFIALHAGRSYATAVEVGRANGAASRFLTSVRQYVDAHANEPGFTFRLASHPPALDPEVALREDYADEPRATSTRYVTEILFSRYYRAAGARDVLDPGR